MTALPGVTPSDARPCAFNQKNDLKAQRNLIFSSYFFNAIGSVFTASGVGIMSCSKKLESMTFGAPFIFAGGIIITLLGIASLYAGNQVNAPMKKDPKSEKLLRPTTNDTVEYWLKTAALYGRYLAVTNAPYTNRQDLVVRALAPNGYGFDTIGSGASEQEKVAIFLDGLARFIFQMKQLSEK